MSDKLSNIFDVAPVPRSDIDVSDLENSNVDDDASLARNNIRKILEVGNTAISDALMVAQASENPRAYEVLANMLKTVSDINLSLLDSHKKQRDMKTPATATPQVGNTVTNNIAFVGTTKALNDIIMERLKNETI